MPLRINPIPILGHPAVDEVQRLSTHWPAVVAQVEAADIRTRSPAVILEISAKALKALAAAREAEKTGKVPVVKESSGSNPSRRTGRRLGLFTESRRRKSDPPKNA